MSGDSLLKRKRKSGELSLSHIFFGYRRTEKQKQERKKKTEKAETRP